MAHLTQYILLSALTILASSAACGGHVVTNATELGRCLGFNGTPNVDFTLKATVTWATTSSSKNFLVKTDDGRIGLADKAFWPKSPLSAGDVIIAHGKTVSLSNGFVNANCLAIDVVGHVTPDPLVDTTIGEVISGRTPPLQPIRLQGILRDVFMDEIDHRYRCAIISSGANSISLAIRMEETDAKPLADLIGAKVCVIGYRPTLTGSRQLCRTAISLHSADDIVVVSPPPEDPFAVPAMDSIRTDETASIMNLGRHAAKGTVIAVWQQREFALRTDGGGIVNISLADGPPPECGAAVEVAGLPFTDLYRINLRRAIWRKMPGTHLSSPECAKAISAAMLFTDGKGHREIKPDFHGKAISLKGTVVGVPSSGLKDGIVRLLSDDFTVSVDASATPAAIEGLEVGSKVEMSGTCIVKTDSWWPNEPLPRIRDVVLVVRAPSDVRILALPPWWTPGRLFALIAVLLTILAAFLLWNVLLRRLAEKRGNELMRTRFAQAVSKLKVQERTRIAVELHDTIAQNLTGVSLEIDSAEQLAAKDHGGMMKHLDMAARTLQSCRNELRNCLWDLRSHALEESDLNEAIRRAVSPMVRNVNLTIRFNVPRKAMTDDTAHVLMRIVRELVMNAVCHGGAPSVKIAGSLDAGMLLFSVHDDGCGFDPATCPGVLQGHFGLQGIRERVNQFGGEMRIESAPGKGTKVTVKLFLAPKPCKLP